MVANHIETLYAPAHQRFPLAVGCEISAHLNLRVRVVVSKPCSCHQSKPADFGPFVSIRPQPQTRSDRQAALRIDAGHGIIAHLLS